MSVTAVVLVGGQSSRMGKNKAFLMLRGQFLVEHMIQILKEVTGNPVLIGGELRGFSCLQDNDKNKGPLAAIEAALKAEQGHSKHLLFVPVDMPAITTFTLKQLLTNKCQEKAAHFKGTPLPLLLPVNKNIHNIAKNLLNSPYKRDRSIQSFLEKIKVKTLPCSAIKNNLINTNTPEEWANFIKDIKPS